MMKMIKLKVFVGMYRPTIDELKESYAHTQGSITCPCSELLHTSTEALNHWQLGHFDKPQHIEVDGSEFIAQFIKKLCDKATQK